MKDKSNGRDKDYILSKEETSSPALVPETSTAAKGSPPRARLSTFGAISNGEDHNYKEKYYSPEARHSKKHKKSKKKKKSKDKDRHRDSG